MLEVEYYGGGQESMVEHSRQRKHELKVGWLNDKHELKVGRLNDWSVVYLTSCS